jgi:hypothetical protein
MKIFMTIDFESINRRGDWLAYAIMLVNYPTGDILDIRESACYRKIEDYDKNTLAFWQKHNIAHQQLLINGKDKSAKVEEQLLCDYISNIMQKFPKVYLISDNPQHDLRLIDNMLLKHDFDPISVRGSYLYFQAICSWSFQTGVLTLLNKKKEHIDSFRAELNIHQTRRVDDYFGPRHTPQSDCARIISSHFKILDIVENLAEKHHVKF